MPAYFDERIELNAHTDPLYVFAGMQQIGQTRAALRLRERGYDDRFYIPLGAIEPGFLQRADKHTHCPYKGDTHYYHVVIGDVRYANAGRVYPQPRSEMAAIADRIAFDHPGITLASVPRR